MESIERSQSREVKNETRKNLPQSQGFGGQGEGI